LPMDARRVSGNTNGPRYCPGTNSSSWIMPHPRLVLWIEAGRMGLPLVGFSDEGLYMSTTTILNSLSTMKPLAPAMVPDHAPGGCPACRAEGGKTLYDVTTSSTFHVVKCRACGMVYAAPRPTPKELDTFYTSTYFTRDHQTNLGYANYREVAEVNARRTWKQFHRYVPLEKVVRRKLLDAGCATGGFLAEAKAAGWDCLGVELSDHAVDIARNEFGLDVVQGNLDSESLTRGAFGLVTMWHVLEHLIDPAAALARARELLLPGGWLFIELPNWNSLGRVAKGPKWKQLKPPEHINFFTPHTLAATATRAGFRVLRCDSHYPSMMDKAAVRRWSQPFHCGAAAIALAASAMGRGGYVRLLAERE
jgi:2-polyprenyl-3-methyl-5-hydroxy-6-metoxy-1,4-benzoquinol methylase